MITICRGNVRPGDSGIPTDGRGISDSGTRKDCLAAAALH